MKYKVKVTVIDKKLYPEFVFYRDGDRDDFWHMVAPKHGMPLPVTYIQACRAVL